MENYENIAVSKIAFISREEASDLDRLISLFCEHIYVYIHSNDKLYGIINIGDFKKYSRESEYINTEFLYVTEGDNLNQDIDRIIKKHKKIREFPVLSTTGKLLYIKRRRKHIVNSFNFDWSLCNDEFIKQFFYGYERICYFNKSEKIQGLQMSIGSSMKMKQVSNIRECKSEDILIIHNEYLGEGLKAYNIDEVYLAILSRSTVQSLSFQGAKYFFFQSPVAWKCRKENKVFYQHGIDNLASNMTELTNIFGDYTDAIDYWTEHDYSKVKLCEVNGCYLLENVHSHAYNVQNNLRVTLNQPTESLYTIYIIGTCIARGYGVSDNLTIPSLLQMKLNREGIKKYRVLNYGTGGGLNSYSDIRDFVNIRRTNINKNDIIIHLGYNCWELEKSKVEFDNYYELSWLFNQKHEKRCFIDYTPHLTAYANEFASQYIFDKIKSVLL